VFHRLRLGVLASAPVALLCGAAACGGPRSNEPTLTFDPCRALALVTDASATTEELTALEAGLALWNDRARTALSRADRAPPSADAVAIHFQQAAAPFHGLYDGQAAEIFINTDLADHQAAVAVAHEVGHAFGLVHVAPAARASVMNPGNLDVEPTAGDVAALGALWGTCQAAPASQPSTLSNP